MQSGIEEGAEIFQPDCVLPDKGFFFRPTLFTGVSQSHRIAQEEIFGPVLSVLTFRTPEEAIEKANNTPYGLSAGVWTEKGSRIFKMVGAMRAGVVWANTFNRFDPTSPVRRLQGVRLRARGRTARPGRLPRPVAQRHERPMIDTERLSEVNLDVIADGLDEPWQPIEIAAANDAVLRMARMEGQLPLAPPRRGRALPVLARRLPHRAGGPAGGAPGVR